MCENRDYLKTSISNFEYKIDKKTQNIAKPIKNLIYLICIAFSMANLEIGEKQLSSMTSYWKERKAERQAYKLKKRSKKDLQYVVIAGQEKRLDKLMNNLKRLSDDISGFEQNIIIANSSTIKLERSALEDIQGFIDTLAQIKQMGVPPAIIQMYKEAIANLLDKWQKDLTLIQQHNANLSKIAGTLKQQTNQRL